MPVGGSSKAGRCVTPVERWGTGWMNGNARSFRRAVSRHPPRRCTPVMYEFWIKPTIGHVRLDRLNVGDINRVLLAMQHTNRAGATRRACYTTLRKALDDDAMRNDLLSFNPAYKVKQPKAKSPEARFLTTAEVAALLQETAETRWDALMRFILGTGLRRGEALALRWKDVDLDAGNARIQGSLVRQDGSLVVSTTKTAHKPPPNRSEPRCRGALDAPQGMSGCRATSGWQLVGGPRICLHQSDGGTSRASERPSRRQDCWGACWAYWSDGPFPSSHLRNHSTTCWSSVESCKRQPRARIYSSHCGHLRACDRRGLSCRSRGCGRCTRPLTTRRTTTFEKGTQP